MKKTLTLLLLAAVFLSPALGFAESPWTEKATYNSQIAGKLQFGLQNALLGWLDLFIEPTLSARHCKDSGNVVAGIGKGMIDAVYNTAGGVFQAATFPLIADVPLPDNGVHPLNWGQDCGKTAKK